jgi:hypothetical protein
LKKLFGILLLICLVTPFFVTLSGIQLQKNKCRKAVKKQVMQGVSHEALTLLKFKKEDASKKLIWKHSSEFAYEGQMFDVVRTESHGEEVWYWCLWDHHETKLERELNKLVAHAAGRQGPNKENQKRLQHFVLTLFYAQKAGWELLSHYQNEVIQVERRLVFSSLDLPPPVPPPRIV